MPDDVIKQLGKSLRSCTYRRLSSLQTLRLTILELLVVSDAKHSGYGSVARLLHHHMEGGREAVDSDYLKVINCNLRRLQRAGLIDLDKAGTTIRVVSITDAGETRLRQLLELERDDYQTFLREVAKL